MIGVAICYFAAIAMMAAAAFVISVVAPDLSPDVGKAVGAGFVLVGILCCVLVHHYTKNTP